MSNENNSPIVSIIVPVYNVAPYLRRCVDSLINQTFEEIEIILINDGSTDNSGEICDEVAEKDRRIIVIHKKNGGVAGARNAGLDVAKGKYISFIDSDDYIEPDMIEKLVNKLELDNAEIAICNAFRHKDGEIKKDCLSISNESISFEKKSLYDFFDCFGLMISVLMCNKLFCKEIIQKVNLRFSDMNKVYSEDQLFIICYFRFVKNAAFVNESLYHYDINCNSISRGYTNYTVLNQWINLIKEIKMFMDTYDRDCADEHTYRALMWSYFISACNHFKSSENFYKAIDKVSKENMKYLRKTFLSVALGKAGTMISKSQGLSFKAMLYFRFIALLLWLGKYDRPLNTFLLKK